MSTSFNEHLAALLRHLEVPGEGVVLDSQGGLEGETRAVQRLQTFRTEMFPAHPV